MELRQSALGLFSGQQSKSHRQRDSTTPVLCLSSTVKKQVNLNPPADLLSAHLVETPHLCPSSFCPDPGISLTISPCPYQALNYLADYFSFHPGDSVSLVPSMASDFSQHCLIGLWLASVLYVDSWLFVGCGFCYCFALLRCVSLV